MAQTAPARSPWPGRRRRAEQLRERYPFAAEVLTLLLALLHVQEPVFEAAAGRPPDAASHQARELMPRVIEATVAAGPRQLGEAAVGRFHSADLDDVLSRWLRGAEQSMVDRYLARAAWAPVLEAMEPGPLAVLCAGTRAPERQARCPACGGPPQLAYTALSDEALVTGPRHLVCARCSAAWAHPRMVCPGCGETTANRLPVYSEEREVQFPHLRVDGCETCRRHLLVVDLRRDAAAVPEVDELAALPLDLYAKDRGFSKITPNLMGF
jgi:formate dehydrogenase maturation protein FdhE